MIDASDLASPTELAAGATTSRIGRNIPFMLSRKAADRPARPNERSSPGSWLMSLLGRRDERFAPDFQLLSRDVGFVMTEQ